MHWRKKAVLAAALCLSLWSAGTAEARIDSSHMALGGIREGTAEAELYRIYGPPKTIVRNFSAAQDQYVREYNYGDSFFVLVTEADHRVRWAMAQDTPNAMTTPEGIGIGSSLNSVLGAYGAPDLRQIDGEVDYLWYFSDDESPSRLVFCVSYSKVVGITCGSR